MDERRVIIIEDDPEDVEILTEIFKDLGMELLVTVFKDGKEALDYFSTTEDPILLIISDISLPRMDGLEMKKYIENDLELKKKSIPFIFYTSEGRQAEINEAFLNANVHGYFEKGSNYKEIRDDIEVICRYWHRSKRPF